jgi:hypothetical protein
LDNDSECHPLSYEELHLESPKLEDWMRICEKAAAGIRNSVKLIDKFDPFARRWGSTSKMGNFAERIDEFREKVLPVILPYIRQEEGDKFVKRLIGQVKFCDDEIYW